MKNIFYTLMMLLFTATVMAQVPSNISYQAVIRKPDGSLVVLSKVGFKFSIHQTSNNGPVVYEETQNISTNKDGVVTLKIGAGTPVTGTFSAIDWTTGLYFVKTRIDVTGGTNFVLFTVAQFSSVPYAFHANTADSVVHGATADFSKLTNKPANLDVDATNDVTLTGNQDIAGVKTFTGSLRAPNPQVNGDVVTKDYIDSLFEVVTQLQDITKLVLDGDGNTYTPGFVGTQIWLKEPLRTTHYLNGDPILTTAVDSASYMNLLLSDTTNGYYLHGILDTTLKNTYGLIYGVGILKESRKVCPLGYRIPTKADIDILFALAGPGPTGAGINARNNLISLTNLPLWGSAASAIGTLGEFNALPSPYVCKAVLFGLFNQQRFAGAGASFNNTLSKSGGYWTQTRNPGNGSEAGFLGTITIGNGAFSINNFQTNFGGVIQGNALSIKCVKE